MCENVSKYFDDVTFSVIQCDPNFRKPLDIVKLIKDISDFYNENWLGNADYLHVPDTKKVFDNYTKYPTIMAYREDEFGQKEILGVATLKYYQNSDDYINPYYPIANKRFFEITGILVKRDSDIKNIGKMIYEIFIKSLMEYAKVLPEFDVIFVADCRNYMSINGARGGATYVRELYNADAYGKVVGVYTVKKDEALVEAPTLVAKLEFTKNTSNKKATLSYTQSEELFQRMLDTILVNLDESNTRYVISNMDEDCVVDFYEINDDCINLDNLTIIPNGTDLGNDRVLQLRRRMKVGGKNE